MQCDITTGLILNPLITPDVVAMTVGADDQLHIGKMDIQLCDQAGGFIKVGNIGGVDQDRVFRPVNKMIGVEKTAFDKIQVL